MKRLAFALFAAAAACTGFAATPIVTAGGVHVEPDETLYAVAPVKLVIDASAFEGDRQTLIETATDSTAAFQKLIGNKEGKGHMIIADGGTKLVYCKVISTRLIIH